MSYHELHAAIKAFCGEERRSLCTSSNAPAAFRWAIERNEKLLSFPTASGAATTALPWAFS